MTDHFVEVPKKVLSPAAEAVRSNIAQIMYELHQRCRISVSATDTLPIILETNEASLQAGINSLCAAAIRALADQVVPHSGRYPMNEYMLGIRDAKQDVRDAILAIATELEGQ